ncbi:tetratricopeptide repeat protein [Novosphingobium mangrovi (ex Huang et al. 2023)]|uniref:Tetratricopeptide repeat protein n=1 Tax=Novosphingobium mangrovi (ex Huang et al. 2023) TaxID=2976432 RepID=A0ABT2I5I7_9SPHN|nr:tetratricopeptide repeat protein [Novosphingobium mangrovi (ex Huang et al. 2023)]MCT2400068.1 tetratricopeptide repeat protein [Novosphingobium mangrovi (ex Huang et al. 2023)]
MNKRLRTSFVAISLLGLGGCQSIFGSSDLSHVRPGAMSPRDRDDVVGLALLIRGRTHIAEGNLAAAAEALRMAQRFPETKADATNGLGVVYARMKRFDVAARYFREATEMEPSNNRFATNLHRLERTTRVAVQKQPVPSAQGRVASQVGADARRVASQSGSADNPPVLAEAEPRVDTRNESLRAPRPASGDAMQPAPAVTHSPAIEPPTAGTASPATSAFESAPGTRAAANGDASRSAGQKALQQARAELTAGNLATAARLFRVAQRQGDTLADASNGLGVVYARLGRPDLADRYMQMAAALEPANPKFAANIQRLHGTVRFAHDDAASGPARLRDLIPAPAFGKAAAPAAGSGAGHIMVDATDGLLHDVLPPVQIHTASLDAGSGVKEQCQGHGVQTLSGSRSCLNVVSSPGAAPVMEVIGVSSPNSAQDQVQADAAPVLVAFSDATA